MRTYYSKTKENLLRKICEKLSSGELTKDNPKDIMKALNISRTKYYYHFKFKEDLVEALTFYIINITKFHISNSINYMKVEISNILSHFENFELIRSFLHVFNEEDIKKSLYLRFKKDFRLKDSELMSLEKKISEMFLEIRYILNVSEYAFQNRSLPTRSIY